MTLSPVTVLGLGPMGQALARAFATAGHPTTVWNRTRGKAAGLPEAGTLDEAIKSGSVIVACLMNYDAVSTTLDRVGVAWEDRTLVNLSSGTPAEARAMTAWVIERGIRYLDGAILTPTPTIGTPAATVLYSGGTEVHPALRSICGAATHLGDDPGRANAYDVALLDLFAMAVHGIVHAFALAAAEDIPAPALARFATGIGPLLPDMITGFADQIEAGEHPGNRSTIASAKSAIEHIIATAAGHGVDTGALTAMRAVTDRAIADGHGPDGLSYLTTAIRGQA